MKRILILTGLILYFSIQIQQQLSLQQSLLYIPDQTKYSENLNGIEKKIKIAIVDTEVNWKDHLLYPYMKNQQLKVSANQNEYDHATMVSSMLINTLNQVYGSKAKELFEVKVFSYKFYENKKDVSELSYLQALDQAIAWNPDVLNISVEYWKRSKIEELFINLALMSRIKVISSAGNLGNNHKSYPCSFEGVICVGAKNKISNFGDQVSVVVKKSSFKVRTATGKIISNKGTSLATPIVTAYYASLMVNKDSAQYFDKLLTIKNPNQNPVRTVSTHNR